MRTMVAWVALLAAVVAFGAPAAWAQGTMSEWNNGAFSGGFFDDVRRTVGNWWDTTVARPSDRADWEGQANATNSRPTRQQGAVREDQLPWSGDWWPRGSAGLAFKNTGGGLAPFEKYDSIVLDLYGQVPGAAAWEADPANQHNDAPTSGTSWAGHCNGLAAAAILTPEPRRAIRVPLQRNQLAKLLYTSARQCPPGLFRDGRFDYKLLQGPGYVDLCVDDMKGWLAEVYMTCETQQLGQGGSVLGNRYGKSNIDFNDSSFQDIFPQNYHYVLDTFVRQRRQSVVAEIDPHMAVNNHPVCSFDSQMKAGPGYYYCQTKVVMTDYAKKTNYVGTNTMTRDYTYVLRVDQYNRVTGGEWTGASIGKHPDFIWIPVADQAASGNYENPCVRTEFASYLLQKYGAFNR